MELIFWCTTQKSLAFLQGFFGFRQSTATDPKHQTLPTSPSWHTFCAET